MRPPDSLRPLERAAADWQPTMADLSEIELLIRARYPILYVVTSEETRLRDAVLAIAKKRQKKLFEWSCTTGIVPTGTSIQSRHSRDQPTAEPLAALNYVIDQVEPALYLFKDFHPFLTKGHAPVIRRLKEIAVELKNSLKTLILVSPVLEMPVELEKELTVLTQPLPDHAELGALLDRIIAEIHDRVAVDLDAAGRERLLRAALGLTLTEAENVFAKIIVQDQRLSAEDVGAVLAEKQQIIRKSGLLEYHAATETFSSIGGLETLKDWLRKRALAFGVEARRFGLPAPKGILMLGVQGCGKSLCAKAVSALWELPLLRFDVGRVFGSLVGSSEENMRRAIAVAESVAPAILWVDEIDKAFSGAQGASAGDNGTAARVFGTFLTWLSEKQAPVFVAATANEVAHLPPELLRKGRFDEIFFVDLPAEAERGEIFRIHLSKRGRDPGRFDVTALAAASGGFSGAEIEQAVISGLYDAFWSQQELGAEHVLAAVQQTVPLARTMDAQIGRLRQWAQGRARPASAPAAGPCGSA
jgi:ATP-dependent 26S proteasome regulatory subunit